MNNMNFEDIDTSRFKSKKSNPLVTSKPKYSHKTIRIYEEDYKELKRLAYERDTTIVELMGDCIRLLKNEEEKVNWSEKDYTWFNKKTNKKAIDLELMLDTVLSKVEIEELYNKGFYLKNIDDVSLAIKDIDFS
ncbi:MAG: hypothetical protein ACI35O_16550 [Bacillaceae bacterium]